MTDAAVVREETAADHVYAELKNIGANTRVFYDVSGRIAGVKPGQTIRVTLSRSTFLRIQAQGETLIAAEADPLAEEAKTGPVSDILAEAPGLSYHELLSKATIALGAEQVGRRPSRAEIIDVLRQHAAQE